MPVSFCYIENTGERVADLVHLCIAAMVMAAPGRSCEGSRIQERIETCAGKISIMKLLASVACMCTCCLHLCDD